MVSDARTQIEVSCYLELLQGCFAVWMDTMDRLCRAGEAPLPCEDVIAAIGPVAAAHGRLAAITVTADLLHAHQAAMGLLQSAMDALDAVAQGTGKPAIRDMSEQLTIFQSECYRLAGMIGVVRDT